MIKYVKELKYRALLIFLCWTSLFLTNYYYKEIIVLEVLQSAILEKSIVLNKLIFTNISELFSTYIELFFFISNQVTLLYLTYNFIQFIIPGLYNVEYKTIRSFLQAIFIFWFLSSLCLYFYIIPLVWDFLLSFQKNLVEYNVDITFEAKISEYLSFLLNLYYSFNNQFMFVIGLFLILSWIDNIKHLITKFRKFFYLLFLLISTFLTPPDITSQILVYFSLILLFELFLMLKLFILNSILIWKPIKTY